MTQCAVKLLAHVAFSNNALSEINKGKKINARKMIADDQQRSSL